MTKNWTLKRTKQCAKCPWKRSTNPHEIPNGYSTDLHENLRNTIAEPGSIRGSDHVMACHESPIGEDQHCVGWIDHQLGRGNNIGLRMQMMTCSNIRELEIVGEQHECFEDTLPTDYLIGCEEEW